MYDEEKKSLAGLGQASRLRRFTHTSDVTPDECYHFRKAVTPQREMKIENGELVCINDEAADALDGILNDTLDVASPMPAEKSTPVAASSKKNRIGRGKVTGYIIYSSEHRRGLCDENPGASFGDISRMLGDEWKNMEQDERSYWEMKAAKMNEESKLKWARESANMSTQSQVDHATASPGQGFQQGLPLPNQVRDVIFFRINFVTFCLSRSSIVVGNVAIFSLKIQLISLSTASPTPLDAFKNIWQSNRQVNLNIIVSGVTVLASNEVLHHSRIP